MNNNEWVDTLISRPEDNSQILMTIQTGLERTTAQGFYYNGAFYASMVVPIQDVSVISWMNCPKQQYKGNE